MNQFNKLVILLWLINPDMNPSTKSTNDCKTTSTFMNFRITKGNRNENSIALVNNSPNFLDTIHLSVVVIETTMPTLQQTLIQDILLWKKSQHILGMITVTWTTNAPPFLRQRFITITSQARHLQLNMNQLWYCLQNCHPLWKI